MSRQDCIAATTRPTSRTAGSQSRPGAVAFYLNFLWKPARTFGFGWCMAAGADITTRWSNRGLAIQSTWHRRLNRGAIASWLRARLSLPRFGARLTARPRLITRRWSASGAVNLFGREAGAEATVHDQRRARHKGRVTAGEEDCGTSYFFGLPDSS